MGKSHGEEPRVIKPNDLAEAVRFELTNGFPLPVFKTGAIDHSATLPLKLILREIKFACHQSIRLDESVILKFKPNYRAISG